MYIDENESFREVVMRGFSSLRFVKALQRTLLYLRTIMLADTLFLSIENEKSSDLNVMAFEGDRYYEQHANQLK